MNRVIQVALGVAIGLTLATVLVWWGANDSAGGPYWGTPVDPPMAMGELTLASDEGPIDSSDLQGEWVAIFFGYTSCPDVCPFTMVHLSEALGMLDPEQASRVKVVFVTVDPERDTPERAAAYARQFDPGFMGLSGTRAEIEVAEKVFCVRAERAGELPDGGYLVDHTASVKLLDPRGRLVLIWPFDLSGEQIAEDLGRLVR